LEYRPMRAFPDQPFFLLAGLAVVLLALAPPASPAAAEGNFEYSVAYIEGRLNASVVVREAAQARPEIEGDRSARVVLAGSEGERDMDAHWKPVAPPGRGFNNEPRYELAAYRLQKLFLEECEYVVPPVVLRALPADEYRQLRGIARPPTIRGTNSVLFMLSYWVQNVTNRDPWDPARFAADPRYARHWGNLNILTHLIDHKDANIGNLLISRNPDDPRVFAVDNDVAFGSEVSDQGDTWRRLQVDRLPQRTVERLRGVSREDLDRALGVVAEFQVVNGLLQPVDPGANLSPRNALRTTGDRVQFGLTSVEIGAVKRRIERLLLQVDRGRIRTVEDSPDSVGLACLAMSAQ
jgi:hypothetical protein